MTKYEGIIDEILFYSERSSDGKWIIPIEVDWEYHNNGLIIVTGLMLIGKK